MKVFLFNGYQILVGQNARENDALVLGSSEGDMWFHIEDKPGSHVIIKKADDIDKGTIEYAARLAVPLKVIGNVGVIYTDVYNVEKKRYSKPGEVTVETFSRIVVKV